MSGLKSMKRGKRSDERETRTVHRAGLLGFLGFAVLLLPVFAAAGGDPVSKPRVPIVMAFGAEGTAAVGSDMNLSLTVTPLVPSESVAVSVILPEGLRLIEGDAAWTGSLAEDASHVMTITVRPEQAASLTVKGNATLYLSGGSSMSRRAVFTLEAGPSQPKPSLRERRGPGGDAVLEIPLQDPSKPQ